LQFPTPTADNCEMDDATSSFSDEPQGPPRPGGADPGLEMREPYLRRVLADFEAGHLESYEYTRRVLAINAAGSTEEMSAIVNGLPDGSGAGPDAASSRGLDAVDLARLRATRLSESRNPNARYITLAVVFLLFAVLIGIGMWLATHVHGAALSLVLHSRLSARPTPWWS
jgi:hypothetical protein